MNDAQSREVFSVVIEHARTSVSDFVRGIREELLSLTPIIPLLILLTALYEIFEFTNPVHFLLWLLFYYLSIFVLFQQVLVRLRNRGKELWADSLPGSEVIDSPNSIEEAWSRYFSSNSDEPPIHLRETNPIGPYLLYALLDFIVGITLYLLLLITAAQLVQWGLFDELVIYLRGPGSSLETGAEIALGAAFQLFKEIFPPVGMKTAIFLAMVLGPPGVFILFGIRNLAIVSRIIHVKTLQAIYSETGRLAICRKREWFGLSLLILIYGGLFALL